MFATTPVNTVDAVIHNIVDSGVSDSMDYLASLSIKFSVDLAIDYFALFFMSFRPDASKSSRLLSTFFTIFFGTIGAVELAVASKAPLALRAALAAILA
jgi:hypothetical protein